MPSQASQKLSQSSPLCLPLLKFSYATVSNENVAPIPWIHLSSKNALFAIFETSPVQLEDGHTAERQKFKILKDPEVMEELDLNALSVEAHRVLAQAPSVSSANIPTVAIIVKVPMIAIKYPLTNGQIRRFQIRFGEKEDYYEAMKMLSRANVPTVEAGTFPVIKGQIALQPAPANLVAPDDSASQIGLPTDDPKNYITNDAMRPLPVSRQAPAASSAMALPQMFSTTTNRAEYRPSAQPTAIGAMQTGYASGPRLAYPKSNISLSTATTLVPGKHQLRSYAMHTHTQKVESGFPSIERPPEAGQHHGDFRTARLNPTPVPAPDVAFGHPPTQELPIRSTEYDVTAPPRSVGDSRNITAKLQQCQENEQLQSAKVDDPESSKRTSEKGKGKRAGANNTKKAPAAKKSRAAASPKKKVKSARKETPVPTVEELLRQPGYSLLPYNASTKARSMPHAQQTSQKERAKQAKEKSMEIPESEHEAELRDVGSPELDQAITRRMTRAASRAVVCVPLDTLNGQQTGVSTAAHPPCTPADQIIANPLTPATPPAPAYTSPLKAMAPPPGRQPSPDLPPDNFSAVPDDPLLPLTQQCLAMDANFDLSNAESRLEAWSNLPVATRITATKSYFCELIMQDHFAELCRAVGGLWEGAILEGRIARTFNSQEEGGDERDEEEGL